MALRIGTLRRRYLPVVAFAACCLAPSFALAQSAEDKAAARTLGTEGIKLANAGDCAAAIDKLTRAEALYHAPTILGRLGECQVALGMLVEGTENLNRVVREALPANAPPAYKQARDRAQGVLDAALPRIAKLRIVVEPVVEGLEVLVGDKSVPAALLGAERPTDPGTHQIVARAPGYRPASAEVTLAEGGAESVSLALVADESAAPPPVETKPEPLPPPAPPPVQPADSGAQSSDKTLAYVLWGVGGAGLVTGAVTGVMAMGKKGDLDDKCTSNNECPPSAHGTLDSARTLALVSTIGFGVGIAGAAAGTVLYFMSPESSAALPTLQAYGTTARPYVTPTGAGVVGQF